jgi:hypothetical protein
MVVPTKGVPLRAALHYSPPEPITGLPEDRQVKITGLPEDRQVKIAGLPEDRRKSS